jgi:hypothetical protein
MQLKKGSAIVSIASSRRPAEWPWNQGEVPLAGSKQKL